MPRLFQLICVLVCLAAARPAGAFSLLGTFETWQTPAFGYNPLNTDIGAPKNLGEEYRWNAPVITYAFDNSFLNYFGNEGAAAIDAAAAIINSLPDLSSLSQDLKEFPLVDPASGATTTYRDSRRTNLRAEADGLLDLKSMALGLFVEQLGLASPEQWTWALADRRIVANGTITQYLTIQRNFDPVTLQPSKYVNGNRYTFQIFEFDNPAFTDPIESLVDPEHRIRGFSSVANTLASESGAFLPGMFYTYLTRDDIGGLRYIYNTNNLNWESFPANTLMYAVDRANGFVSLTNQDLTLLSLRSQTSSSNLMQTFYPGLVITQATPNPARTIENVPIVVTQRVSLVFNTNFSTPVIVSNIDLATFSSVTLTSAPANLTANLQAAFPGVAGFDQLIVLSTNFGVTSVVTAASVTLTNTPRQAFDDPFTTNFVFVTNFVTNLQVLYRYTFRNVQTNYSSPFTTVLRITTGLEREPFSSPFNPVFRTNITQLTLDRPSGAITLIPTNLVGYIFTGNDITNVIGITNFAFTTNFVDPLSGLARTVSRTDVTLFTNVQYFAYPIEFLANPLLTNVLKTNGFITTNIVTYNFAFANVTTNYSSPTTPALRARLRLTPDPLNPSVYQTNVLSAEDTTLPVPSGGFLLDTNRTGFEFSGFSTTSVIPMTTTVSEFTDENGVRTVEQLTYNFTNTVYLVFPYVLTNPPASALRGGVSKVTLQRVGGTTFTGVGYSFTNQYTVSFYTNGLSTNAVFQTTQAQPDILIRAVDLGRRQNTVVPIQVFRTSAFQNNAALNSNDGTQGGPGAIVGPVVMDFNKIGPSLVNQTPGVVTEASALSFFVPFLWGSFDGSTNPPVVYPKDITLEQIELLKTGGAVP